MYANLNQKIFMQFLIANLYMRRHNLTPEEFLELDNKCNLLKYIELGYEPFHLTGTEGIMEQIENYVNLSQ